MPRRVQRFQRGPRRATDWSASSLQAGTTTVPASSAVLTQAFVPLPGGETVIRIRGSFGWQTDTPGAPEVQVGAYGIAVVTAQAVSVGITAIPHPVTDAAWGGWMYHHFIQSSNQNFTNAGFAFGGFHRIEVDSKAMRKVDEDDRLVMVVENSSSSFGFEIMDSFRLLSKVH